MTSLSLSRLAAALMLTGLLAACSSSDHDDDTSPETPTQPTQPASPQLRCAP